MADYTLTVYQDDDTTVLFEVGTAADHAHPYLKAPSEGKSAEVDIVRGTASIGQQDMEVIDPQTGATQADRWLTALLGTESGYSALNGRRAVLAQVSPPAILTDGVAAGVTLLESLAGFRIAVRDIRERGVKLKVFTETTSCTVLPRGVLRGYGKLPSGGWVVVPTKPLVGTYRGNASEGLIELDGAPKKVGDTIAPDLVVTPTMQEAMRLNPNATAPYFDLVSVRWRPVGSTDWSAARELRDIRAARGRAVATPQGYSQYGGLVETRTARVKMANGTTVDVAGAVSVVVDNHAGGTLPTPGQKVEVAVCYVGPVSKDYPLHFEGGWGEFVRNLLRGDYGAVDETGARVSPRIRVDDAALLAIDTPIRVRLEEEKDDMRRVLEELCLMIGAAPAVDDMGRLAPVLSEVPDVSVPLAQIDDTNAQPIAGWDHPTSGAVTQVTVTYPRDYAVPAGVDPNGGHSAGDGIASKEVTIVQRPGPGSSVLSVMGVRDLKIDAWAFRALGAAEGAPASGDVTNEQGAQLAAARAHQAIDRLAFGGVSSTCQIAASAFPGLKIGDWVLDARSWRPNYATGKRGGNALAQVVSLRQKNPAWYEVRLVDAAPSDNPAGQPTLGAISVGADGVVSVEVATIAAGTEARVDYAISETVPAASAPGWTFLGRTGTPGTLKSPPLPAAANAWIRARGEGAGRRPSAWTVPVSATAPGTPRILSASLEISAAGVPTAAWTTNASALGMRVYYAAHPEGEEPTLTAYVDAAAADGAKDLPTTVRPGEAITIEEEPWTGWTGAAVSGTAGDRVRRTAVTSVAVSSYGLDNFREIEASAPGKRRWGWTSHGVRVESIWWAARAYTMPFDLADAWADLATRVEPLPEGQNWVEIDVPADDENVLVQVEPRLADLTVYDGADVVERVQVYPVPSHLELSFSAGIVDGKVDLTVSLASAPGSMPYPATVEVYEGDPLTGALLTTIAAAADGRWTKAEVVALGGRALPAEGKKVWTAVATDRTGTTYVREAPVNAPRLPVIDGVRSVLAPDLLSVSLYGVVSDSTPVGGTLEYWLPTAPDAPPDPSGAPTGSKVITAAELPYSFGPTQIPALGGIVTAGSSLTVVLRFIATDGRSTGKVPFPVAGSMQYLVDALGKLRAGSVHNGLVLASQYRPYFMGTGAPTGTPTAYGTDRYFDSAALQPYTWTGSAWVVDAATPSVAFAPILRAGVVTAEVIDATAVRAKLVGAERITAENITASLALEVGQEIRSTSYSEGVSGWKINADGTVDFNGGNFRGVVRIDSSTDFAPGYNPATKTTTFRQASAPTALAVGDLWIDTDDSNHPHRWDGSAWVSIRDSAAGSTTGLSAIIYDASPPATRPGGAPLVQGDQWVDTDDGLRPYIWSGSAWVAAYTSIDGGNIKTGAIQSIVYTPGVAGWMIDTAGSAEFNDVTIRGTLKAGTVMVDGGKDLNLARGLQSGIATDDQTITFERPFPTGTVPLVLFGGGGITYDSTHSAGTQAQRFRALNVTESSFKASLKIVLVGGAPTPKSIGFSGATATKTDVDEATDKTYTISYDVHVGGNFGSSKSSVTIGFYANGSLYATRDYSNPEPSGGVPFDYLDQSLALVVTGMVAGSTFTVQVISSSGAGGTVTPSQVAWSVATYPENPATPAGFAVPWIAVGGA